MTISMEKTYCTRHEAKVARQKNRPIKPNVRILMVDGGGEQPVVGAYCDEDGEWRGVNWSMDGKFFTDGGESLVDVVEVKPERKLYLNIYPGWERSLPHNVVPHLSREAADQKSRGDRVACVEVIFHEGDGVKDLDDTGC